MKINFQPIAESEFKSKYESEDNLGFGKIPTDRMFILEYRNNAWQEPAIIKKWEPISLDPSAICLHYGQTIFEGQKAYRTEDGHLNLFRPDRNITRFNKSAKRMMMPEIDPEIYMTGLKELLKLEKDWAPKSVGSSLYIRPTMIGTEPGLGARPSNQYLFYIILSPSGPYFPEGFNCIKILVSEKYIRAAPGGVGYAKTGGNYGASFLMTSEAEKLGFSQVLWLDAIHKRFMEEVGTMNIFFVYNDVIHTAPLDPGTILAGVTRESVIQIAKDFGYTVKEEMLAIDDLIEGIYNGKVTEAFGTGTAASIAPVGSLFYQNKEHVINNFQNGEISTKLYERLIGIQYGLIEDPYGWIVRVP